MRTRSSPTASPTGSGARAGQRGLHGHRFGAPSMIRAGLAEALGTFFLVYTGTATAVAATLGKPTGGAPPNSLAIALAFGLVLIALVGALGQVCGVHFNGAVTLGLAVTGKFPWRYVPAYLIFQLLGAIAGAGATWVSFGNRAREVAKLGATVPADGVGLGQVFVVEALITFLLVFVIIAVATDARVPAAVAAPAIGFALVAAVLIGGGVSGGAVNPDRAVGPAIMSGTLTSLWVYVLATVIGGIAAAVVHTCVMADAVAPTVNTPIPTPRPARETAAATPAQDITER
jgi:MIP family channel proteins